MKLKKKKEENKNHINIYIKYKKHTQSCRDKGITHGSAILANCRTYLLSDKKKVNTCNELSLNFSNSLFENTYTSLNPIIFGR